MNALRMDLQDLALGVCRWIRRGGIIVNNHTHNARDVRLQVDVLSKHFEFVHHDQLLSRLVRKGRKPFCLMTFDDGKKINVTDSAPELYRLGVPAVFYVVTDFLSSACVPLWFDSYRALIRKRGVSPPALEVNDLKKLPHQVLRQMVDAACGENGVVADLTDPMVGPMSWDDARALHAQGFTIGSHTTQHAILTNEPRSDALEDIRCSMAEVTNRIGAQCTTFAFPNGNYRKEFGQHALSCGAKTVMTTEPVWASSSSPAWALPRIQLDHSYGAGRIRIKVLISSIGFVLRNPDGTGRRYVAGQLANRLIGY